jgi:endonuclease YncB( thermonuclease family)
VIRALVVQIVNGDSLAVATDGEMVRVQLAEIDAPEGKQPFTIRSKQSLSDLCLWVHAELSSITKDQYGRTLAKVKWEGLDANAEQVRRGMAWAHGEYAKDPDFRGFRMRPAPPSEDYGRINRLHLPGYGAQFILSLHQRLAGRIS